MNEAQLTNAVRKIIRQEMAMINMSQIQSNSSVTRSAFNRSTQPPFENSRTIFPYGYASRAPAGTPCLVIPIGGNATNQNIVGHHDPSRPSFNDGEVMLYNEFGQQIYLQDGFVRLGVSTAAHPVNLGDIVQSVLSQFLEIFADHTHPGPGYQPVNAAAALALKADPVDNGHINSAIVFTE